MSVKSVNRRELLSIKTVNRKTHNTADKNDLPSANQLDERIRAIDYRRRFYTVFRSSVYGLIVVAALSVLVATIFLPVLRIYGSSMTPTVSEGQIVVSLKGSTFRQKDVIALWYGNKLLVKRVIAGPNQWVDIDRDGNVYVDGSPLEEPYLTEKSLGDCNITLPYQVPDGRYFVMGDHRSVSQDSRNTAVGCVAEEQIVGKIVFSVWPLGKFGKIRQ